MPLTAQQKYLLLEMARATIRNALRGESKESAEPLPDPALSSPGGSFVSLHELQTHRLRGCVGRLDASQPLWESVHNSAIGVIEDPRFLNDPVTLDELPSLEIEISVLSPMRPVASPLAFEPENEGIYLTHHGRSGCFLPQVARDTGWTREQLLDRLCSEKLDLAPTAWREPGAKLMVFSALLIGPEPFER
jgi:AmmeMemoRadiSam system protein A